LLKTFTSDEDADKLKYNKYLQQTGEVNTHSFITGEWRSIFLTYVPVQDSDFQCKAPM
jgi:hypothetical protein